MKKVIEIMQDLLQDQLIITDSKLIQDTLIETQETILEIIKENLLIILQKEAYLMMKKRSSIKCLKIY